MTIADLQPDDTFYWNDWTLEVRAPAINDMVPCKVVGGPWTPGIWWNFHASLKVRRPE